MVTLNVTWGDYMALKKSSEEHLENLKTNVDQFFLVTMGMICFLMQGGFAFLEAGAVRSKNSTNILIKNLMDSFVAGAAYWTIGYALAYGEGNSFIGYGFWASKDLPDTTFGYFFFQYVFAATAATIVSGAMAERCEFMAYFIYSFFITAFIYPVVTHWAWTAEGWLAVGAMYGEGNSTYNIAYQDFAGSGALHALSGVAAFVGAFMLGPRIGRFHPDHKGPVDIRGHSIPFAALGGFILIFGFFAFNGGSSVTLVSSGGGATMSLSIVNTIIAGSVSAFVSLGISKSGTLGSERWSLLNSLNGALTGMVSICSGCNVYYPWGAAVMGFVAAWVYKLVSNLMLKLKVDDPLDAVAVHFGGGVIGVIGVAFLKKDTGILFAWDVKSAIGLGWQIGGLLAIITWTAVWCLLMFGALKLAGILRVNEEMEIKGLDIPKHGEPAYPVEAYGHGWGADIMQILNKGKVTKMQHEMAKGITGMVRGIAGLKKGMVSRDDDDIIYDSPEAQAMGRQKKNQAYQRAVSHSSNGGDVTASTKF